MPSKSKPATVGDDEDFTEYIQLVKPHVDSFDWLIDYGLDLIVEGIKPIEVRKYC